MNTKDLKIGSKMTLSENREYRIIDIRNESGKDYIVCCTTEKPILPITFEYRQIGEDLLVREEKDKEVLKVIYSKMIKENS